MLVNKINHLPFTDGFKLSIFVIQAMNISMDMYHVSQFQVDSLS